MEDEPLEMRGRTGGQGGKQGWEGQLGGHILKSKNHMNKQRMSSIIYRY